MVVLHLGEISLFYGAKLISFCYESESFVFALNELLAIPSPRFMKNQKNECLCCKYLSNLSSEQYVCNICSERKVRIFAKFTDIVKSEYVFVIFPGGVTFDEHLFCHAGSSWLVHWDSLHLPIVSNNCHADISRSLHDDGDDETTIIL